MIDHNRADLDAVHAILAHDFEVLDATTGTDGLRQAEVAKPALVLVDHMLPDANGLDLIPEILRLSIPVIMLTGAGAEEVAVAALKAGASDYVAKERLTREVLTRAIVYAFEKSRLRSAVQRQEARLQGHRALLFTFLDAVPIGIYVLDGSGTPYFANQRAIEILGRGIVPGAHPSNLTEVYQAYVAGSDELYPPESLPIVRALAGETSSVANVEIARPEGRVLIAVTAKPIFGPDGEVRFAIAAFQDRTREAKLAAQYRRAQKMEGVGRLAGGVAHDFNNLLTAIVSFGNFARDALGPGEPAHDDLTEVLRAAGRAAKLTQQLLAFSQKQPVLPESTDLNPLVSSVVSTLSRTLGAHIEIETRLCDELWRAWIDPALFEQVIVNLAVNARDAMPRGGTLVLATQNVSIQEPVEMGPERVMEPGDYVSLSVADNGVGMDPATAAQVFEPFFTTKVPVVGTGLGLAMCDGTVRQAGGFIAVDSTLGRGTTVRIHLPRHA